MDLESGSPKQIWIGLERETQGRVATPRIGDEVVLELDGSSDVDGARITMLCCVDLVKSSFVNQLNSSSYFGAVVSAGVMVALVWLLLTKPTSYIFGAIAKS